MNTYKSSAQLKEKAKIQLAGKYGPVIGIVIVLQLINFFSGSIITMIIPSVSLPALLLQYCATFIISIFTGVFNIGFTLYFLNIACGRETSFTDIIYGFQNHFNKSLTLSLIMTALTFFCEALYIVPYYTGLFTGSKLAAALTFPFMALGLIIYVLLYLRLALVYFLILDFPDYSTGELLKKSNQLMQGHKGRLFYIDISFFPLVLLGACTCMIGMLWVLPYEKMTKVLFFLDLMNPENTV